MSLIKRRWCHALMVWLAGLAGLAGCQRDQLTPTAPRPPVAIATSRPATAAPEPTATAARPTPSATPSPPLPSPTATPQTVAQLWGYPLGQPGLPAGDGFYIRHGYAAENTWYNPGYWHTGEDWYAQNDADTAGAEVYAVAAGQVAYVGGNYPGRVVIIQHADLFSMYGHLEPAVRVTEGQAVERGTLLGTVLRRGDTVPNHLHFEIRTFLTTAAVNGDAPRLPFRCGPNCPPGPGYWPINDRELPDALGWRNPTHAIAQRGYPALGPATAGEIVVASQPISTTAPIWDAPPSPNASPQFVAEYRLEPGERLALLAVAVPPDPDHGTSAASYGVWYQVALADGRRGWLQASVPSTRETGADGRPSSVFFNFLPSARTNP